MGYQNWISSGAGKSGLSWLIAITKKNARIDFRLSSPSSEINKKRFDFLFSNKNKIENIFGKPIIWDFKENRKQNNLRTISPLGGIDDEDKWPAIQNDLVERIIRLEKALRPYIKEL